MAAGGHHDLGQHRVGSYVSCFMDMAALLDDEVIDGNDVEELHVGARQELKLVIGEGSESRIYVG